MIKLIHNGATFLYTRLVLLQVIPELWHGCLLRWSK
jgi:hypothetical protein